MSLKVSGSRWLPGTESASDRICKGGHCWWEPHPTYWCQSYNCRKKKINLRDINNAKHHNKTYVSIYFLLFWYLYQKRPLNFSSFFKKCIYLKSRESSRVAQVIPPPGLWSMKEHRNHLLQRTWGPCGSWSNWRSNLPPPTSGQSAPEPDGTPDLKTELMVWHWGAPRRPQSREQRESSLGLGPAEKQET